MVKHPQDNFSLQNANWLEMLLYWETGQKQGQSEKCVRRGECKHSLRTSAQGPPNTFLHPPLTTSLTSLAFDRFPRKTANCNLTPLATSNLQFLYRITQKSPLPPLCLDGILSVNSPALILSKNSGVSSAKSRLKSAKIGKKSAKIG